MPLSKFLDLPVFISRIWPKSVFIQFESLSFVKLFFGKGCRLSFPFRFNLLFLFFSATIFQQCARKTWLSSLFLHCNMQIYTRPRTANHHTPNRSSWLKKTECQLNLSSMEGMGWPPKAIHIFSVHKHFKSRWNCLNQGNVLTISLNVTDTFAPIHLCSFLLNILNIWMNPYYRRHQLRCFHFWHFPFRGSHIVAKQCFVCYQIQTGVNSVTKSFVYASNMPKQIVIPSNLSSYTLLTPLNLGCHKC